MIELFKTVERIVNRIIDHTIKESWSPEKLKNEETILSEHYKF